MFAKVTNGQIDKYPYTVGDLRRDNPNTSFPRIVPEATMAKFDMYPVSYEAAPEYDPMTQRIEHSNMPILKDGKWMLTKTVVALTEGQIAQRTEAKATEVRKQRDKLLDETDWVVVKSAEIGSPIPTEMATYRQALRDITEQTGFPYDVQWPTKPE